MTRTTTEAIVAVGLILTAFTTGRYLAPTKTVETVVDHSQTDANNHTITHTVVVKVPGGNTTVDTTVDSTTKTKIDDQKKDTKIVVQPSARKSLINISALAGVDILRPEIPIYGIAANKEFLGPITIGAFGLTNGVVGVSIGISF